VGLPPAAKHAQDNADVIAALTSLGYSLAEASRAVTSLPSSKMALEERIKLALQYFSSK
jgi:Holliday junction resolvasome RuvABC DNA-binding subunit